MIHPARRFFLPGAFLSFAVIALSAPAHAQLSTMDRQLSRIDFAVSGMGSFTSNTNGNNYQSQNVQLRPSNTVGALVTLRYTRSALQGAEFNYTYARYTDDFTFSNFTSSGVKPAVLGVQTNVSEYTLGYVAHTPRYFGLQPFISAGGGGMSFHPTSGGGQGVPKQVRGALYYSLGVEDLVFGDHLGVRAQFRQVFFGAPDFSQNYLANNQRSIASEPAIGVFVRF